MATSKKQLKRIESLIQLDDSRRALPKAFGKNEKVFLFSARKLCGKHHEQSSRLSLSARSLVCWEFLLFIFSTRRDCRLSVSRYVFIKSDYFLHKASEYIKEGFWAVREESGKIILLYFSHHQGERGKLLGTLNLCWRVSRLKTQKKIERIDKVQIE